MIEKTAGYGLAVVTGIMSAVGVLMFLLPPVPGVPVYLALGIVLPAQGHKDLGERSFSTIHSEQVICPHFPPKPVAGWPGSILYCTGVGLALKLFCSALQQKGIRPLP